MLQRIRNFAEVDATPTLLYKALRVSVLRRAATTPAADALAVHLASGVQRDDVSMSSLPAVQWSDEADAVHLKWFIVGHTCCDG